MSLEMTATADEKNARIFKTASFLIPKPATSLQKNHQNEYRLLRDGR